MKHKWQVGQKAALAEAAGMTPQHLSNILAKGTCEKDLAARLEEACQKVPGLPPVGRMIWLYGPKSSNPLLEDQV